MAVFRLSAFADEASPALDLQIAALSRAGIDRVEMRGVNGKSVKDLTLSEAREIKKQLDAAGIRVSAMGSPFGKIGVDQDFDAHFSEFTHALALCRALGTDKMRVFSFYIPSGDAPEKWRGEVIARLTAMLDAADAQKIRLAHENEKGIYGDTGDRCLDLMEALGDRLGCIFDPANFIQCGDPPLEQFEKLEKFITYLHVKDALFEDGAVVPCGAGDGQVAEILGRISARADELILSVEPHLSGFVGLDRLQDHGVKHKYAYPDNFAAFQAAADALKETLNQIGYQKAEGEAVWKR